MKKTSLALALLSLSFLSHQASAESFRAKVKLTLVDPSSISQISENAIQTVSIPIKPIKNSHCSIDAQNGMMNGSACLEQSMENPKLNISGRAAQNISVKLSKSAPEDSKSTQILSFEPSLFNGFNQEENFQLTSSSHNISIGGTIFQHDLPDDALGAHQALQYGVEVLYP